MIYTSIVLALSGAKNESAMAKDLASKDAMMMLAGGVKGNEPLVFNDGGKPYRAFLEGRVDGDKYRLILHLTDLELKPLPEKA